MQFQSFPPRPFEYPDFIFETSFFPSSDIASFNWPVLKAQLLHQWPDIRDHELELAGRSRRRIASLIAEKYRISATLVENYLRNFEQTIHKRLGVKRVQ